jgi:superfamily II DNA or RNA helicase
MKTTKLTREEIQKNAYEVLEANNFTGTCVMSTGAGKTKVAIDVIKKNNFKNILITSPRTNLKENWRKELDKWNIKEIHNSPWNYAYGNGFSLKITIENIQTCYKWDIEEIQKFDLIIADEIHTIVTPEYSSILYKTSRLHIPIIGLTATPDDDKDDKSLLYEKYCPIVYTYLDAADDGLINKRRYITLTYELTDDFKVIVGTKHKKWEVGEATQYAFLTEQIKKGQKLMASTGSQNWFGDAADWFWKGLGTTEQKNAARVYLNAIKYRKEFLWNLTSSAKIANAAKDHIIKSDAKNKVLLFSELTTQADKLSAYSIHSKQDEDTNKKILDMFNSGEINTLSSVRSLTLGLNMVGANYAIMESYNSSSVDFTQKAGRTDRLDKDDIACVIWIVPINTQAEEWYKNAIKNIDKNEIEYVSTMNELYNLI